MFAPHIRSTLVERNALIATLNQSTHKKATLVCAPAGFSKSTLVSRWLYQSEHTYCWFSLDEQDNDPKQFFGHLLSAFSQINACSQSLLDSFANEAHINPERLMSLLINELLAYDSTIICVLDDVHLLDNQVILDAIRFLLDYQPKNLHLVLLSREDLPFSLSKYRAKDEIVEIRSKDLSFNHQECAEFFNKVMALELSDDEIEQLNQKIEGWPVGLQLIALSLKNTDNKRQFLSSLALSHRYVLDYLMEEVFSNLTQEQKHFLLGTSFLQRFNPSLCNAVLGIENSHQILNELQKNNLFIICLDAQGQWYRYHHLFSDVLVARNQQENHNNSETILKAAKWFEENNLLLEAIDYALAAKDEHAALTLIEIHWPTLRLISSEQLIMRWVEQLNEELVNQYPVVTFYWAFCLLSTEPVKAKKILDTLNTKIQSADTSRLKIHNQEEFEAIAGILDIAYAYYYAAMGDSENTIKHAQRGIEFFADDELIWRSAAQALLSIAYMNADQLEQAKPIIETCISNMMSEPTGVVISFFTLLIGIELTQGDLISAQTSCEQAIKLIDEKYHPNVQGAANIYADLAKIAIEKNQLDTAQNYLNAMAQLDELAYIPEQQKHVILTKAGFYAANKQYEQAHHYLEQAKHVKSPSPIIDAFSFDALHAQLHLLQNQLDKVATWVANTNLTNKSNCLPDFDKLIMCRFLIINHSNHSNSSELNQAQHILTGILDKNSQRLRPRNSCEAHLLLSVIKQIQNESQVAEQHLQQAVELAQKYEYKRLLSDLIHLMPTLANLLNTYYAGHKMIQSILKGDAEENPKLDEAGYTESGLLSEREQQVLKMLASERSGPEIAASLFISLNTLRTHTKKIYTKLEVNNRRAALIRAKSLNLL